MTDNSRLISANSQAALEGDGASPLVGVAGWSCSGVIGTTKGHLAFFLSNSAFPDALSKVSNVTGGVGAPII